MDRVIAKKNPEAARGDLGVDSNVPKTAPADILAKIMAGQTGIMGNGWHLKRVKVSSDDPVEVISPRSVTPAEARQLTDQGALVERIQFRERYFIPTREGQFRCSSASWRAVRSSS